MTTLIAIKPCPQGQQPGESFEAPEDHAAILVFAGVAQYADKAAGPYASRSVARRRGYQRRDLQAEAS